MRVIIGLRLEGGIDVFRDNLYRHFSVFEELRCLVLVFCYGDRYLTFLILFFDGNYLAVPDNGLGGSFVIIGRLWPIFVEVERPDLSFIIVILRFLSDRLTW